MLEKKAKGNYDSSLQLADLGLLAIWIIVGTVLRWANLDLKPASSIEIATIGYSLGHGFSAIALDRLLSIDTLLAPLHFVAEIGYREVFTSLTTQSTHPPLYFWLTHWWVSLWMNNGDLVTLKVARSLSVVFGVLTIPATFYLAWISWRDRLTAHLAAVLMAISPYGIYLAQEARHYTLTILWVIVSLICLIKSLQIIQQQKSIPFWLGFGWILVNALGTATHYFYVLALAAEAIALGVFYLCRGRKIGWRSWRGICFVVLGTLASCLVWIPLVTGISNNELTSWLVISYRFPDILLPIPRLLGWALTMVMLLPLQGVSTAIAIISAVVIAAVVIYSLPKLIYGENYKSLWLGSSSRLIFSTYLVGAIVLFLILIYGLNKDISTAARYHFVYFPVLILLLASLLAKCWQQQTDKKAVILLIIMGCLGSLTVINDYGFQKSRHSNALAAFVRANSLYPAVVAMRYETNSEVRELMGIAYAFQTKSTDNFTPPQFLLNRLMVDGKDMGLFNLDRALDNQPRPLEFWAINLAVGESDMNLIQCYKNEDIDLSSVQSGYRDRLYTCQQRTGS